MDVTVEAQHIVAVRDDGVAVGWDMPDWRQPLPHDLVHFVVESTFEIEIGFWGLIARGAMFAGMSRLDGRGRKTDGRRIVERHRDALVENEVFVGAVVGWWRSAEDAVPMKGLSPTDVERCYPAFDALAGRTRPFTLGWPAGPAATRS